MKTKILRTIVLLALWCGSSAPGNTLGAGWGLEVGRANETDVARLIQDQLSMEIARNRIEKAITRPLEKERQLQVLGRSTPGAPRVENLHDSVYEWWLNDVMKPAEAIAENPAASCAQAGDAIQTLFAMMRQRQLLGLETDFWEMYQRINQKATTRCEEEALDECVATGRWIQIPETAFALARQSALLGGTYDGTEWAKKTLKQCATYDLHFVSTTHLDVKYTVDTVLDGRMKIEFVEDGGSVLGMSLRGESIGGNNPFLVSIACQRQGTTSITCAPGATPMGGGYAANIVGFEMKHREFYTGPNHVSAERIVGENKLVMEFRAGTLLSQMVTSHPREGNISLPFPIGSPQFWIAHNKDQFGEKPTVKFEQNQRGAYPIVFDFIYADQNVVSRSQASDSTHFELIHKIPEEIRRKLYPPRKPEPTRRPVKPRP